MTFARRNSVVLGAAVVLYGALALRMCAPLFSHGDFPAFHHDWAFPPTMVQWRSHFLQFLEPSSREGLNGPNFYPFNYPLSIASLALTAVLPDARLSLLLILIATLTTGAAGTCKLAMALTNGSPSSVLAGLLYLTSPFTISELGAGHLGDAIGFAVLPWIVVVAGRARRHPYRVAAELAVLTAVAGVQPQFFLFAAALGVATMLLSSARLPTLIAYAVLAVCGEAAALYAYAALDPFAWLRVDQVTLAWQLDQSAAPWDALVQFGYFDYAERVFGGGAAYVHAALAILSVVAATGLVALALARKAPAAVVLGAGIVGFLMTAGLRGPLAPLLTLLYVHVPAARVIRELYHFASLTALALCTGTAVAVGLLGARRGLPRLAAVTIPILVLSVTLPYADGTVTKIVGRLTQDEQRDWERAADVIANDPAPGRVLFVPEQQPLTAGDVGSNGADPEAFVIGSHPNLNDFQPTGNVPYLARAIGSTGAAQTLASYGVEYVALRPHWRSERLETLRNGLHPIFARCDRFGSAPPRLAGPDFQEILATPSVVVLRNRLYAPGQWWARTSPPVLDDSPEPSISTDDPRLGWVAGARWASCFGELASLPYANVFTLSGGHVTLHVSSRDRVVVLWAPGGALLRRGNVKVPVFAPHMTSVALPPGSADTIDVSIRNVGAVAGLSDGTPLVGWEHRCEAGVNAAACRFAIVPHAASPLLRAPQATAVGSGAGSYPQAYFAPAGSIPQEAETVQARVLRAAIAVQALPWLLLVAQQLVRRGRRRDARALERRRHDVADSLPRISR